MATPRELSMLFARIQAPGAAGAAQAAGNAAEQLAQDLQEAAERQVDEITLYAYALIREQDAAAFITAVRKAFP
jgi:predicted DNA-binding transcriptional regulator YafY